MIGSVAPATSQAAGGRDLSAWILLVAFVGVVVTGLVWMWLAWIRHADTREKVCVSLEPLRLETGSLSLLITARNEGRPVRVTGAELRWRDDKGKREPRKATPLGSRDPSRYLVKGDTAIFSVYKDQVQKWLAEGLKLVPDQVKLEIKLDGRPIATVPGKKVVPLLKQIVADNEAAGGSSSGPTSCPPQPSLP